MVDICSISYRITRNYIGNSKLSIGKGSDVETRKGVAHGMILYRPETIFISRTHQDKIVFTLYTL